MPKLAKKKSLERIIDANANRVREGLRVCEEIARFILEDLQLTRKLKNLRHAIAALMQKFPGRPALILQRESRADIGKNICVNELRRKDCQDIFFANIQRAKESLRVLEEFSKLRNTSLALAFKNLRYQIYDLEKKFAQAFTVLRYHR